jgi:hypothetical protein
MLHVVAFYSASCRKKIATGPRTALSHRSQGEKRLPQTIDREASMVFVFLSIGAIALFGIFLPTATYFDTRRKEQEAFYKAETLRRITESSGDGAKAAMEMLREEARRKRLDKRESLKVSGLINIAVGVGMMIFLHYVPGAGFASMAGLIPGLIGVAILIHVYFLAAPIE